MLIVARHSVAMLAIMWLAVALSLEIPLGLDLYMPAPEDNPITSEKIELGRRLFQDRVVPVIS